MPLTMEMGTTEAQRDEQPRALAPSGSSNPPMLVDAASTPQRIAAEVTSLRTAGACALPPASHPCASSPPARSSALPMPPSCSEGTAPAAEAPGAAAQALTGMPGGLIERHEPGKSTGGMLPSPGTAALHDHGGPGALPNPSELARERHMNAPLGPLHGHGGDGALPAYSESARERHMNSCTGIVDGAVECPQHREHAPEDARMHSQEGGHAVSQLELPIADSNQRCAAVDPTCRTAGGEGNASRNSAAACSQLAPAERQPTPAKPVARGLAMGSANPHMIHCADDRAPAPKRSATFDPIAHLRAEAYELSRRPLPEVNVAPVTEPLPPLEPVSEGAPVVTSVEQVVPKRTLRLVRAWIRKLRRCLRLAAAGRLSLARRLRPADLWLPHAQHSMPATRAWDYDLRPLESGLPARPLQPSGVDGVRPASDLIEAAIGRELQAGFTDEAIASEAIQGVRDDAECERGSLLCAPHVGALKLYSQAREKLLKNEQKGWATGGWELPCWPLRAAPYSVVDESERAGKPKFRLTNDLSWPHPGMLDDGEGGYVRSINGSMARERWPRNRLPRAARTGEAAAILKSSGAPVKVWGLDGEAYYRVFGRQRAEIWRNAAVMLEGFQLDERCCFGSAADATKCSRFSNLIAFAVKRALRRVDAAYPTRDPAVQQWLRGRAALAAELGCDSETAEARFLALHAFSVYIDDGTGASIDDLLFDSKGEPLMRDGVQLRRAQLHFETAVATLESFGHTSSKDKEQPPGDSVESLGLEINVATEVMRIIGMRRDAYAKRVDSLLERASCDREELISLLSKLLFAATCYPAGRPWLDAAWRAARTQFAISSDRVILPPKAKAGLRQWATILRSDTLDGVPLAHSAFPSFGSEGCGAMYADASGLQGWCAWTVRGKELLITSGAWTQEELDDPDFLICEKELLASTLGLVTLTEMAGLQFVYQFTDNTVAEGAMRRLAPRTSRMQDMIRRRSEWMRQRDIFESAERISTHANLWADLGSRSAVTEVERQAEALGLRVLHLQPPEEWRDTSEWRQQSIQQPE